MNGKTHWNRKYGEMTETHICALHGAPERARVSTYRYDAGDEVEGTSRPCTLYLVSGSMELVSEGDAVQLNKGDVIFFRGGDYVLRISEAIPAVAVWAWELARGM